MNEIHDLIYSRLMLLFYEVALALPLYNNNTVNNTSGNQQECIVSLLRTISKIKRDSFITDVILIAGSFPADPTVVT